MKQIDETEIKYLAGLIDSDGYISFNFVSNRLYLTIGVVQSLDFDKDNYLESLAERFGRISYRSTTGRDQKAWTVKDSTSLNKLVPRLVKHMIIKARHLNNMFDYYLRHKGQVLSDEQIEKSRMFSKESRLDTGPLKPKNQPSWAWVAGYLDGDGHYNLSLKRNTARVEVCAHTNDICGLELLQKAFGGSILQMSDKENYRWFRNLGVRDKAFAKGFLRKVHAHSRFKKWKIEQILAFHNRAATTKCDTPFGESDSLKL